MAMINSLGLILVALIVWWFWLYKPREERTAHGVIEVAVADGVYLPSRIRVPAGRAVTLRFLRRDASPCAAMVVFSDLEVSEELPLNRPKEVHLSGLLPGKYPFTCQMQMYRGELVVEG